MATKTVTRKELADVLGIDLPNNCEIEFNVINLDDDTKGHGAHGGAAIMTTRGGFRIIEGMASRMNFGSRLQILRGPACW